MSINRPLLYLAIGVGCLTFSVAALVYANAWWLSGIVTLSIGCWLSGLLWTIYTPRHRRAEPLGALVCSFLYVLLSAGPWFQSNVSPWLLTTRALVAMDTYVLGHPQPQPVQQVVNPGWLYSGYGGFTTYPVTQGSALLTIPQLPAAPPAVNPTVAVGQWLFAWCAAAIGGFAAGWIARRARSAPAEAARGQSPFREALE